MGGGVVEILPLFFVLVDDIVVARLAFLYLICCQKIARCLILSDSNTFVISLYFIFYLLCI